MWICLVALYVLRLLCVQEFVDPLELGVWGLHFSGPIAACECGVGQLCCMVVVGFGVVGFGSISPIAVESPRAQSDVCAGVRHAHAYYISYRMSLPGCGTGIVVGCSGVI